MFYCFEGFYKVIWVIKYILDVKMVEIEGLEGNFRNFDKLFFSYFFRRRVSIKVVVFLGFSLKNYIVYVVSFLFRGFFRF